MADTEPQDPTTYTGLVLVLSPVEGDSIVAASSEPAHLTTVYMGEAADYTDDQLAAMEAEAAAYAAELDGPIVVPVTGRGTLGDDGADVAFLEPTDSLLAMREGLLETSPTIRAAMDSVEQFPEWSPHVTLGYPETPARAEYDGTEVAFDRIGLWVAGEQKEFPMGSEPLAAGGLVEGREPLVGDSSYVVPKSVMESMGLSEATIRAISLVAAGEGAGEIVADDDLDEELPVDELEDDEEEITEIPVHGVATIEGKATGDGRMFARGALTHRNLPLPLRLETVGTHGGTTSDVVTVGRIDEMWREEGDEYDEYRYRGVILTTKQHAAQAIEGIVDRSLTGVSVETDATIRDPEHGDAQDALMSRLVDGETLSDEEQALLNLDVYSESRVCGFTIVPIPAFQEAYIGLGHEFPNEMTEDQLALAAAALEDCGCADSKESADAIVAAAVADFAPGTRDGPGWITHPIPTSRIRRYWVRGKGAAKIKWGVPGDFNRCRSQLVKYVQNPEWLAGLCANMHKEALGVWPGQEGGGRHALLASGAEPAPLFNLAAAAIHRYPAEWFTAPTLDDPSVGVVVDGDRVYGYIAQWGVCHIGIQNVCTTAPFSNTDYAYFATGYVHTDDGEKVRVGQITIDTGHANLRASAKVAAAHYDHTGAAAADIAVGEDSFGIWFAGALRRSITDEQRHALEASGRLSGDWRGMPGGGLEMIAALAVNVPGFPIPVKPGFAVDAGEQTVLVAAGIVLPRADEEAEEDGVQKNLDYAADVVERVIDRLDQRKLEEQRVQEARARLTTLRLADARRRLAERI